MQKKKTVITVVAAGLLLIVLGIGVSSIERNKKSPVEHGKDSTQNQETTVAEDGVAASEEISGNTDNDDTEKSTEPVTEEQPKSETWWMETPGDNVVADESKHLKIELISYEKTSKPDPDKYLAEYFKDGEPPEEIPAVEETDWDAVYAEAPELDKIHSADFGVYSREEILAANEKYKDIIDKYTKENVNGGSYYFIKCKVTNMTDEDIEMNLFYNTLFRSQDGKEITYEENLCYFDKPENTEGDSRANKFFIRVYHAGETIECTLGFAVRSEFGAGETIYFGYPPTDDEPYDPDDVPDLVRLDLIPEEN